MENENEMKKGKKKLWLIVGVIVCILLASAFYAGYTIKKEKVAPTLQITSPQNGAKMNESKVEVSGTTDGDTIEVNGKKTEVKDSKFSISIDLVEGTNTITVVAIKDGHKTTISITVFYGDYPLTVVDGFGRKVTIMNRPRRIVSLAPSNTEILFAINAGHLVVGVTQYCNYPPEATNIEKIGGYSTVNIEKVVGLSPDLVLASGRVQREIVKNLEKRGLTVIALDPHTIPEILQNIALVGWVTGHSEDATKVVSKMNEKLDNIKNKTKNLKSRPCVYYEIWNDPLMTCGPGSFGNDLIILAGGTNIAANTSIQYPVISSEFVIFADPEIIIVSTHNPAKPSDIKKRPGWENIKAIKNNKIFVVDSDIVSRPGPRITQGLEEFLRCIHPEISPSYNSQYILEKSNSETVDSYTFYNVGICEQDEIEDIASFLSDIHKEISTLATLQTTFSKSLRTKEVITGVGLIANF